MNNSFQGATATIDFVEHQGQAVFNIGHPRRGLGIRLLFFFPGVRRVVSGNHLDQTALEGLPQSLVVRRSFQRGIHLGERAQSPVISDIQQQMMRAGFGGDQTGVIGEQLCFLSRRNV